MSNTPHTAVRPSLAALAETAHSTAEPGSTSFVSIELGESDVAVGHWPLPTHLGHPTEALMGSIAPERWSAVGLSAAARQRRIESGAVSIPVHTTVLVDRQGNSAAVLDDGCGNVQTLCDRPAGVLADTLRRVLGLPTAPPEVPIGYCVENAWLDAIATIVLARPGEVDTWDALVRLHPLAGARGAGCSPVELCNSVQVLQAESSWARMLALWGRHEGLHHHGPPGTKAIPLAQWFDEGSFARWSLRNLPVAEELLPAVLDALPEHLREQLQEALVNLDGWSDERWS